MKIKNVQAKMFVAISAILFLGVLVYISYNSSSEEKTTYSAEQQNTVTVKVSPKEPVKIKNSKVLPEENELNLSGIYPFEDYKYFLEQTGLKEYSWDDSRNISFFHNGVNVMIKYGKVISVSTYDENVQTYRGIHVGSTVDELEEKYGQPNNYSDLGDVSVYEYEFYKNYPKDYPTLIGDDFNLGLIDFTVDNSTNTIVSIKSSMADEMIGLIYIGPRKDVFYFIDASEIYCEIDEYPILQLCANVVTYEWQRESLDANREVENRNLSNARRGGGYCHYRYDFADMTMSIGTDNAKDEISWDDLNMEDVDRWLNNGSGQMAGLMWFAEGSSVLEAYKGESFIDTRKNWKNKIQ